MMKTNLGIYLHFPFCIKKCNYCDFNSDNYKESTRNKYLDSLIDEIKLESNFYKNYYVDTIFIGGGTPSLVSTTDIEKIVKSLKIYFNISNNIEFTIEVNPNSVDQDKLEKYLELGINRLSIGAQSFVDRELEFLGRIHRSADIYETINFAKNIGFDNINLDLMTSIPLQNIDSFKYSLNEVIDLGVNHISAYSLIIEEGTDFGDNYKMEDLMLPSEDEDRAIYHYLVEHLETNGFIQYEISNFSKPGYESKHNIKYWICDDYLGLGLGAHSRIGNFRFENSNDIKYYLKSIENKTLPRIDSYFLTQLDQLNEKIIMGLRMNLGINIDEIDREFKIDFKNKYFNEINKNLKNGYIEIISNKLKLTNLGRDFSNKVELDFYRLGD